MPTAPHGTYCVARYGGHEKLVRNNDVSCSHDIVNDTYVNPLERHLSWEERSTVSNLGMARRIIFMI